METLQCIGKLLYCYEHEARENHTVDYVLADQPAGGCHHVSGHAGTGLYAPSWQSNEHRLPLCRVYVDAARK